MAARFGLAAAVRTATSESEVMLRLAEKPADIVLADVAVGRPDTAGFSRRVLARAPGAALLLFGPAGHPAAAALTAGARGLIIGEPDAACLVAKALLLLNAPGRPGGKLTDRGQLDPAGKVPSQRDIAAPPPTRGADGDERGIPPSAGPAPVGPVATGPDASGSGTPGPAAVSDLSGRGLTEREAQVLRAMADGKSNSEIGRELYVSEDTVKTHARRLFRKLGARDRAHAVAAGFRAGLVA